MIVPVPLGAVKLTFTEFAFNTVTVPIVGEPGIVDINMDASDATDVPPELVAETVNL